MLSGVCCMSTLVSFPSKHIRVKHSLLVNHQRWLRTVNAHCNLVVDSLYFVMNTGNSTLNASHSLVDMRYLVVDADNSIIDSMCGLQNLRSCHPNFLICQFVQPLEPIFYLSLSDQFLQVFF